MDNLQKILISVGAFILISILIYLGTIWFLKSQKKMKDNKMLTMNLVIKYKLFLEYLTYQDKKDQNYLLFLVKINNLSIIENTYNDSVVRSYLTSIAKELSVYLPFGGKIAQTKVRDTFIMYYPVIDNDPYQLGKQIQSFAQKIYHENGVHIRMTNSVAIIDSFNLLNLSQAMISSVRNLGEPTFYNAQKHHMSDEYINLIDKLKQQTLKLKSYHIETIRVHKVNEVYNALAINDVDFNEFINRLPVMDQAWVNMYMVSYILNELYQKNIFANVSIPILLSTIEKVQFINYIETVVKANQFLLENIILSIKITNITDEDQLIKNILALSNLGMKVSINLDEINQNMYNIIRRYHVKRLEVSDEMMRHELIADLLYFAKVNHIEVLYKTSILNQDTQKLNVTHITKDEIKFNEGKQKRGRK